MTLKTIKEYLEIYETIRKLVENKAEIWGDVYLTGYEVQLHKFNWTGKYISVEMESYYRGLTDWHYLDLTPEDLLKNDEQFKTELQIRKIQEKKAKEEQKRLAKIASDEELARQEYQKYLDLKKKYEG